MVVFVSQDEMLCPKKWVAEGNFLRRLSGKEHARTLHHECVHGSWLSSGKPTAFVCGKHDEVIATIDGNEPYCEDVIEQFHAVINAVRGRQGMPPAYKQVM